MTSKFQAKMAGGARPVYCDGTNWRDITTGSIAA